jgi:hypothetical protein
MKSLHVGLLVAAALVLSHGAGALTLDTRTGVNPDGTARFIDPDEPLPHLSSPPPSAGNASSVPLFKNGNSSFSFGITQPGQSDDRFAPGSLTPFRGFGGRPFGVRPGFPN